LSDKNGLNIRLSLARTLTVQINKHGKDSDWSKTEASVEWDLPSGLTVEQALADMGETLDTYLANLSTPQPLSVQPEKPQAPTPSIDLAPLDPLWKSNSKGAYWIFSDKAPELKRLLEASPKQSVEINGQIYKLSGDNLQFVNRWGSRKP